MNTPNLQQYEEGGGVELQEAKPRLKRPPMYKVMMMNDDFTPMEFVVDILQGIFAMNHEKATQVMLQVHTEGKADCGVFTRDVAETKIALVHQLAQEQQHPLKCTMEQA